VIEHRCYLMALVDTYQLLSLNYICSSLLVPLDVLEFQTQPGR